MFENTIWSFFDNFTLSELVHKFLNIYFWIFTFWSSTFVIFKSKVVHILPGQQNVLPWNLGLNWHKCMGWWIPFSLSHVGFVLLPTFSTATVLLPITFDVDSVSTNPVDGDSPSTKDCRRRQCLYQACRRRQSFYQRLSTATVLLPTTVNVDSAYTKFFYGDSLLPTTVDVDRASTKGWSTSTASTDRPSLS